jgi:flagellar basal-body rod protein FlgF
MENATYTALSRQLGLMSELRVVANNIANANTTGFQREGVMFAEHVAALGGDFDSLSQATSLVRETDVTQGTLTQTGGTFDLAIEGMGYFLVETPAGPRLTRAGSFTPDQNGDLVNMDGRRVLDAGGAPVFIPTGTGPIGIAPDGTISADGQPIGQIGLVIPSDPLQMIRESGTLFDARGGFEESPSGKMVQGFLENSNVNPIAQISRMIEVQRAYELGQSFLDKEDERIRGVIRAINK